MAKEPKLSDRDQSLLRADGAVVDDAVVAWLVDRLSGHLAAGYDGDAQQYREHVHDVIGGLIGLGVDPAALKHAIESSDR